MKNVVSAIKQSTVLFKAALKGKLHQLWNANKIVKLRCKYVKNKIYSKHYSQVNNMLKVAQIVAVHCLYTVQCTVRKTSNLSKVNQLCN